jgi:hypothetical protein
MLLYDIQKVMKHECKTCNYSTVYPSHFRSHMISKRHLKREEDTKKSEGGPTSPTDSLKSDKVRSTDLSDFIKSDKVRSSDLSDLAKSQSDKSVRRTLSDLAELAKSKSGEVRTSDLSDLAVLAGAKSDKVQTSDLTDLIVYNESKDQIIDSLQGLQCEKCNLKFSDKSNLARHKKRCKFDCKNKDMLESINNNICPLCKSQYTKKSGLVRHMNNCKSKEKVKETDIILEKVMQKIEKMETHQTQIINEQWNQIKKERQYSHQMSVANACNMNGLIESNMKAMTFLEKFHTNTPQLEDFSKDFEDPYLFYIDYSQHPIIEGTNKILYNKKTEMTKDEYISDLILFLQETKELVKYYTERIIVFYKNDKEPQRQAVWNVDTSRHNYTVSLKYNDKVEWHKDKQGHITTEKILRPLLEFTVNIIRNKIEALYKELTTTKNTTSMMDIVKKQQLLSEFIFSVQKNTLQPEIIKKLSPLMFFDVKKHKELLVISEQDIINQNTKLLEIKQDSDTESSDSF